ncbi:MAG: ATP synthase F1 subunit epsilon [Chloroflexi bacterium]|nr:ATP synthase F1 subunit epsilon [Chloroflexota bacterium]
MPIHCEIVSQDRQVFLGDADIVVLPGAAGVMGVLPHHSPLLSTLKDGIITVRWKGKEEFFTVAGGIVEIQPDQVTVLADASENVEEIDIERAEAAKKRAELLLKQGVPRDTDTYLTIQASLRKSNLRLDAARRYRQRQGGRNEPHQGGG